jgi:hypothetical protein
VISVWSRINVSIARNRYSSHGWQVRWECELEVKNDMKTGGSSVGIQQKEGAGGHASPTPRERR